MDKPIIKTEGLRFSYTTAEGVSPVVLDGVDLDWEYPVSGGVSGVIHRPQDKQNFTLLLKAIRQKLDQQENRCKFRQYY